MNIRTSVVILLVSLVLTAPALIAGEPATALLAIRNARIPMDGVLSGGQPTPEQIEAAAAAGYVTVINLRTDQEKGFEWEPDAVESLGMRYVVIPIPGGPGLTRDNVATLDAALAEAIAGGPVLLHCGSGNRIGAILALRAAWLQDVEPEAALQYGVASGMTRLESTTRELLGLEEVKPEEPTKKKKKKK